MIQDKIMSDYRKHLRRVLKLDKELKKIKNKNLDLGLYIHINNRFYVKDEVYLINREKQKVYKPKEIQKLSKDVKDIRIVCTSWGVNSWSSIDELNEEEFYESEVVKDYKDIEKFMLELINKKHNEIDDIRVSFDKKHFKLEEDKNGE